MGRAGLGRAGEACPASDWGWFVACSGVLSGAGRVWAIDVSGVEPEQELRRSGLGRGGGDRQLCWGVAGCCCEWSGGGSGGERIRCGNAEARSDCRNDNCERSQVPEAGIITTAGHVARGGHAAAAGLGGACLPGATFGVGTRVGEGLGGDRGARSLVWGHRSVQHSAVQHSAVQNSAVQHG